MRRESHGGGRELSKGGECSLITIQAQDSIGLLISIAFVSDCTSLPLPS